MNAEKITVIDKIVQATLPVFMCDLSSLNSQLILARQAIDELRELYPETPYSSARATYMSPWKSHQLNQKLDSICQSAITVAHYASEQFLSVNMRSLGFDFQVTDCWGMIYENGDHTLPHQHFPADFVSVIYLEADEACAPIVFAEQVSVQPKPGMLVMFPGILTHEVPQNVGRRVVLAMNINKAPYPT